MKWLKRISSLFLISLSIIICIASVKLGLGSFRNPGPGLLPFITSCLIFCLSLGVLIRDFIKVDESKDKELFLVRKNLQKPICLVVALSGYTLLLNYFGYLITTFLLLFLLLFIFDFNPRNWWKYFVIGGVATVLSFIIFDKWFQVQLPIGIFTIGF